VTTGTGLNKSNAVHAFTCSKCHTPHNSKLPRLLVTNCLDVKHRGRVTSSGSMDAPYTQSRGSDGAGAGRFPQGGGGTGSRPRGTAHQWFFGKQVKSTAIASTSQTLCHQTATSGGATYSPAGQLWNSKSPW
jgi:predicted CXXCH cytochrome family protein